MDASQRELWRERTAFLQSAQRLPAEKADLLALEDIFGAALDNAIDWAVSALPVPKLTAVQAAQSYFEQGEGESSGVAFMRALALAASPFPPDAPFLPAARVLLGGVVETAPPPPLAQ
jgi:hypothetical protein